MAYSETLPNVGIVSTGRNASPEDPLLCKLISELTGYKRIPGSPVDLVVIEPNHYREVERAEVEGIILCLPGYQDGRWRAFYDHWGRFPTNGLYAPVPARKILHKLEEEGVELVNIDPLNTLGTLRPGQASSMHSALTFKNYLDAITNDFVNRTRIPGSFAFRPGQVLTSGQILEGSAIDSEPLSLEDIRTGNMQSLRMQWDRVGIIQDDAHHPNLLPDAA